VLQAQYRYLWYWSNSRELRDLEHCYSFIKQVDTIELNEPTFLSVPNHDGQYQFGVLVHFAYKVVDSGMTPYWLAMLKRMTYFFSLKDEEIIIATTRVETMLGDTAIAVNSKDERYVLRRLRL